MSYADATAFAASLVTTLMVEIVGKRVLGRIFPVFA